ncbi:MAG: hypothetical protein CMJ45_13890 [Planctomyces sp.]|jgi:broad specificity phosphatase PhoE|nr:hypothetical protein [Planctomyces sp.]MDP7274678.1 histidine phosphatase family protein [Planctomycetaceae bacterium]
MPLLLIRHAQSMNNSLPEEKRSADPELTDLGYRQAEHLARRLVEWQPERLITSAFRRTLQTTAVVAAATGLKPEVWIDLHEQGGCQSGASPEVYEGQPGMTRCEILEEFGEWDLPEEIDEQGWWKSRRWELPEESETRARRLTASLVTDFSDRTTRVAMITHGMFKQILVSALLDRPFIGVEWLGNLHNTAVSQLRLSAGGSTIDSYNDSSHLPPEMISN